ncbi:hypothetical protein AB4Z32_04560 [Massilia sp. 2TAF26]|uniref:hypothetical protein n=1 Tax=Massilia sp. 2TAF26 TaxID=3233012 RepID=UPI003F97DFED
MKLGAGPGIFLYDSSALTNRKLTAFVKQTAAERKLPLDLVQDYGDDSAEIQKSNGGVPTVNLVVPVRYTHAHNGILSRRDFDQTAELVVSMLKKLIRRRCGGFTLLGRKVSEQRKSRRFVRSDDFVPLIQW